MKEMIFSKFSSERAKKFAIRTDILMDESGEKTVRKTACCPEAEDHVNRIPLWEHRLSEQFAGTQIRVNRVLWAENGSVGLEYLSGADTLETRLAGLWKNGQVEEALKFLRRYLDILRSCAKAPFVKTEQFTEVFGDTELAQGLLCMPVTDFDMTAENIFLNGEDGRWDLIDYEWTFDFPVPVNFLIYRTIMYFFYRNIIRSEDTVAEYCRREGLTDEEIAAYQKMEEHFQSYVLSEYIPLRDMYAGMTPGIYGIERMMRLKEAEDLQTDMEDRSSLYLFSGKIKEGVLELHSRLKPDAEGRFETAFELLPDMADIERVRWDPLEGRPCELTIQEVSSDCGGPLVLLPDNGFSEGAKDVFWSQDPMYRVAGDYRHAGRIVIRGQITFLDLEQELMKFQSLREKDASSIQKLSMDLTKTQQKLESANRTLAALQSTKGFRALEKMRRMRNSAQLRAGRLREKLVKKQAPRQGEPTKGPYHYWYEAHRASETVLAMQRQNHLAKMPKISILVPTYRTPPVFLRDMIDSVRAQTYGNWELCIADGGSGEDVISILREYADQDARIKYTVLAENGGISENTNAAAAMASGDFIALLDHDDVLAPEALYEVAEALQDSSVDVVYTDEDKVSMDLGEYFEPNLKPDFSPDLLRSHNYITHFFVVRKRLFDVLGGFRKEYDGAQDYDLVLRSTEMARKICHVPGILYHWRMHQGSVAGNPESKLYAYEAGRKALQAHLERLGLHGEAHLTKWPGLYHVTYRTDGDPLVSVIIPNKDHTDDLDRCIRSILEKNTYPNLEVIVVENNSEDTDTFSYYENLQKEFPQVRVEVWEREFNFSAINNFGAKKAKGEHLLFLNNDTDMIEPDSIREMVGLSMRPDVGIVGAKLLYADDTVQHVGIVLGFGGFAGHIFHGIERENMGFVNRAQLTSNLSAVTGACMMFRRSVFEQVGGFPEEYPVALNDVEICMRVRASGYLIVLQPTSLWHHYESKSRGYEDTPEKQERLRQEVARFRARWGAVVDAGDPYYNPNFSSDQPFALRP